MLLLSKQNGPEGCKQACLKTRLSVMPSTTFEFNSEVQVPTWPRNVPDQPQAITSHSTRALPSLCRAWHCLLQQQSLTERLCALQRAARLDRQSSCGGRQQLSSVRQSLQHCMQGVTLVACLAHETVTVLSPQCPCHAARSALGHLHQKHQ